VFLAREVLEKPAILVRREAGLHILAHMRFLAVILTKHLWVGNTTTKISDGPDWQRNQDSDHAARPLLCTIQDGPREENEVAGLKMRVQISYSGKGAVA
jgi:hypothetical protein